MPKYQTKFGRDNRENEKSWNCELPTPTATAISISPATGDRGWGRQYQSPPPLLSPPAIGHWESRVACSLQAGGFYWILYIMERVYVCIVNSRCR